MYKGEQSLEIQKLEKDLTSFSIELPEAYAQSIEIGASIAIDGVCLTVTEFDASNHVVRFDMMKETLDVTSLFSLEDGYEVNFERSALMNAENGGHLVSGHIDDCAEVFNINDF